MRCLIWSIAAVVGGTVAALPLQAQTVHYTGSVQYATGDYIFTEKTHSVYVFNGLDLSHGRLQVSASIPVIYQTSPWISYGGVGAVPSGGPQHRTVSGHGSGGHGPGRGRRTTVPLPDTATYAEVGVGDPSLRADLTLIRGWHGPNVRLAGSAKPPVADVDRGFGTGAWDGGLGLALSQRLGSWFLFGEAVHWWLGDMSDLTLQNAVSYSASLGRAFQNGRWGALASLSGYTEIVDGVDPPLQAALGLNRRFGQGAYSLSASVAAGLSESMPDWSISFGLRVAL